MLNFKAHILAIVVTTTMLLSPKAEPSDIVLSKSIKPHMREKIAEDLKRLEEFKFQEPNPDVLKLMKLQSFDTRSVVDWLQERG